MKMCPSHGNKRHFWKANAWLIFALLLLQCLPMGSALAECSYHYATCQSGGLCVSCGEPCDGEVQHNWDNEYQWNETRHWQKCRDCDTKTNNSKHWAFCDNPNVCCECGASSKAFVTHHWDHDNYQSDEKQHWYICLYCGAAGNYTEHCAFCDNPNVCCECGATCNANIVHDCDWEDIRSDETHHWWKCLFCDAKEHYAEHWASCDLPNECAECGAPYSGKLSHRGDWDNCQSDETQHWGYCLDCNQIIYEAHIAASSNPTVCAVCDAVMPTAKTTAEPTAVPTVVPTAEPTVEPTIVPTAEPTAVPTVVPTAEPTVEPTVAPTAEPAAKPTRPVHQHAFKESLPVGDGTHRAPCIGCGWARVEKCKLVTTVEGTKKTTACKICGYVASVVETATHVEEVVAMLAPPAEIDNAAAAMTETLQTLVQAIVPTEDVQQSAVATVTLPAATLATADAPETAVQIEVKTISQPDNAVVLRVFYVSSEVSATVTAEAPATLRLPCEEEAAAISQMKLVLIRQDGTMVEIAFEIVEGEIVFKTDELGMFAFVPADTMIE